VLGSPNVRVVELDGVLGSPNVRVVEFQIIFGREKRVYT